MVSISGRTLFLVSIVYFFSYPEVDPDLWGHLFFGREILRRHGLPEQNTYSYTAPDYSWINHEWLSEVIFYGVFAMAGSPGLLLLKVAVGSAIAWLLHGIIQDRGSAPLPRTLSLVWTMAILSPGFNLRPQIFTYLLFAVFLWCLHRGMDRGRRNLYVFPALTVLWVNLHGGFIAGLGALGVFSLWRFFSGELPPRKTGLLLSCLLPLALSALASVVNPYGPDLLAFLASDLRLARPITEWQPVPWSTLSFLEFKLALVLVLMFLLNKDSWKRWDFVLALFAAALAVRHQRHIPLFGIAAAPFLAAGLEAICKTVEERTRPWLLSIALLAVVFYLSLAIGTIQLRHGLQLVVDPGEYPVQAGNFLRRNGVRGNLAAPFDWGEYLIWKLHPAIRVSVDGRYTTAYPMEVLRDNWEWMQGGPEWRRLLDRYPTDLALTHRLHPVTRLLRNDPQWEYIYSDPVAFIFVRKTVSQKMLLARFREGRLLAPDPPREHFPG